MSCFGTCGGWHRVLMVITFTCLATYFHFSDHFLGEPGLASSLCVFFLTCLKKFLTVFITIFISFVTVELEYKTWFLTCFETQFLVDMELK